MAGELTPEELARMTPADRAAYARQHAVLELTVDRNPWVVQSPTPTQAKFLAYEGQEALYGGAAAGGKSSALLMAALQYVQVPGYSAILFRRTFAHLAQSGALMDRAASWLTGKARWHPDTHMWRFPSGATLSFGYLDKANDRYRYNSAEFQYCVAGGTGVVMGCGALRPVEEVRRGDRVMTLEGPREVLATYRFGPKPVCAVTSEHGRCVVSASHRLLTPGGWASPGALASSGRPRGGTTPSGSPRSSEVASRQLAYLSTGPWPGFLAGPEGVRPAAPPGTGVSPAGGRSGCGASGDSPREWPPPGPWCALATLHGLAPQSAATGTFGDSPRRVQGRVLWGSGFGDFPGGCPCGRGCGGGRVPPASGGGRSRTPSPGVAAGPAPRRWQTGGPGNTPERTPSGGQWYAHPYTTERRSGLVACRADWVEMAPAGEAEVFDLRVEGASHYLLSNGIISSNCGFDELGEFPLEEDYTYLFSRLRRKSGSDVPVRMRAATNPGGVGHKWVKRRFQPHAGGAPGRLFVPARLEDNPHTDRAEYERFLDKLPQRERDRLRWGDWSDFEGDHFKPGQWPRYKDLGGFWALGELGNRRVLVPENCPRYVAVDWAATDKDRSDHTAVVVGCLTPADELLVIDVRNERLPIMSSENGPDRLLRDVCALWGPVAVASDDDVLAQAMCRECRKYGEVPGIRLLPMKGRGKLERASEAIIEGEQGRVWLPEGEGGPAWLEGFVDQLSSFTGQDRREEDDMVDALGILARLVRLHRPRYKGTTIENFEPVWWGGWTPK